MNVQAAKKIVDGLKSELDLLTAVARRSSPSAEKFLDESQFIAFEIVRVTAELDAVIALAAEDLNSGKGVASPELVIAINEVAAEVIALQSRLGIEGTTVGKSEPVASADYRTAVEGIASQRLLA